MEDLDVLMGRLDVLMGELDVLTGELDVPTKELDVLMNDLDVLMIEQAKLGLAWPPFPGPARGKYGGSRCATFSIRTKTRIATPPSPHFDPEGCEREKPKICGERKRSPRATPSRALIDSISGRRQRGGIYPKCGGSSAAIILLPGEFRLGFR